MLHTTTPFFRIISYSLGGLTASECPCCPSIILLIFYIVNRHFHILSAILKVKLRFEISLIVPCRGVLSKWGGVHSQRGGVHSQRDWRSFSKRGKFIFKGATSLLNLNELVWFLSSDLLYLSKGWTLLSTGRA
jgi:hypothetical protein